MLIVIGIIGILFIISMIIMFVSYEDAWTGITLALLVLWIILSITGCFTGFVNHPATEGIHQGVITAVDLEGIYFRRYEVYLKSGTYTADSSGNVSSETVYLIYEYENELAEELKNAIGKEVKLTYGHDGGYISWKSCGTYHIKSFEIVEEK